MLKLFWQTVIGYRSLECGEVVTRVASVFSKRLKGFVRICVTPRMRKCDIARTEDGLVLCFYKLKDRVLHTTNVNEPCGKPIGVLNFTAQVALVAILKPFLGKIKEFANGNAL